MTFLEKFDGLSLSDYMTACLYDPNHGYYMKHVPVGQGGDFITAPEVSQLFGEMIGLWCLDYMGSNIKVPGNLIDCGPGKGTLLADVARVTQKYGQLQFHALEISPILRQVQHQTLQKVPCTWAETFDQLQSQLGQRPSIFVANEFLDAMPMDQYVYDGQEWQKRYVKREGEHLTFDLQPANDMLDSYLKNYPNPTQGDVLEFSKTQEQYVNDILGYLQHYGGACLFIDYGYTSYQYGDTLQALKNHRPIHPLTAPGESDLTTHVNFAWLRDVATGTGLKCAVYTQGEFLQMMGIDLRYQMLAHQFPKHVKILKQGLDRLVNKMGYLFKVMVIKST